MQIRDLFVRPNFDESMVTVSFSPPEGCAEVEYSVLDAAGVVAEGSVQIDRRNAPVVFDIRLPGFKPWTVDNPYLYTLELDFKPGGSISQTFGMTKVQVSDRRILFNNEPIYLRGYIRGRKGHEHANLTGCSTTEFYEKNIQMAKAYGFNFVRFHSVVPPEEFFEAADRLGILCHVEIRKYYGKYQKERQSTGFDGDQTLVDESDWEEMILKLRNHPSVLVYCMGNEINSPGNSERVKVIRGLTRKLDDTRLFLDTTSRGEYDRDTVDLDVQHMSYFAPFGPHYDMFDDSIHLAIYGSVTGKAMVVQDEEENPAYVMRREVPVKFPLLAHEVSHYNVLRDPYALDSKFAEYGAEKPWWVDELIKMIRAKGHEKQFDKMLQASTRFQYIWIKQALESIRKSPLLCGFHFLQLADCDDYENANGLLDCFDDPKDIPADKILSFNGSTVIVADLPDRSLAEKTKLTIPIRLSHYGAERFREGSFAWKLKSRNTDSVDLGATLDKCDLSTLGLRNLCRIEINLPQVAQPEWLDFSCVLNDGVHKVENHWDLWLFPNRPESIAQMDATIDLHDVRLFYRYPQIVNSGSFGNTEQLLITDRFTRGLLDHLRQGKGALVMYRIDENRCRTAHPEEYYLPSTWERFKGVIWDRGHNCGGFLREHPIVDGFPHDGFIDWQFYHLIEDSDKICLDDFPVPVEPIIEGVDKSVRDRFDVGRFDLSEFQYMYTMRKFAHLFELKVGKGRLVVTGMNFKGLEHNHPETCWMFERIVGYMQSPGFSPKSSISADDLESYLVNKGKSRRIKERMMTQYWQLDDAPLESKSYWRESEEWLRTDD